MKRLLSIALLLAAPIPATLAAQDFSGSEKTAAPDAAAMQAANEALATGEFAKAAKLLGPLAEAHPKDPRILYDLGSAQDALDQTSAAQTNYRAAIDDDAAYIEPRLALGLLLARSGKLDDAREQLASAAALEKADKLLRARALRAMARIDQKPRPAAARDELLLALTLSPETPADTLLTAELAETAGESGRQAAEDAYRRLLLHQPNDPEATASLGHLLSSEKRYAEAETLLTTSLAAHPSDPGMTIQLASVYSSQGKTVQALPLVQSLHAAAPADPNVARLLAELAIDAKDYATAEPLLAQLTAQTPTDGDLADLHAEALIHLHRAAEAERILTPAVAQPASFSTSVNWGVAASDLAFAASENNEPGLVLQVLENRAKVFPPSPPILFLTAISEDKLHHVKFAIEAYQKFLDASNGANPNEEFEARHRLIALRSAK
jgi:predicted Zn-dependent protease